MEIGDRVTDGETWGFVVSAKGSNSVPNDRYYTPPWVVDQCVEHVLPPVMMSSHLRTLPGSRILEPSAGDGAFVKGLLRARCCVTAVEPDGFFFDSDLDRTSGLYTHQGTIEDFVSGWRGPDFDAAVGNPPFALAQKHVELLLTITPLVVFLLRVGFITTAVRAKWMENFRPSHVAILRHRPTFGVPDWWVQQREHEERMKGRTFKWGGDSADYAFFIWDRADLGQSCSVVHWLPEVPKELRKAP